MDSTFAYLDQVPFCNGNQYPYHAVQEGCHHQICGGGPVARSRYMFPSGNEGYLLENLPGGPISVCVDASTWQHYQGGVMTSCPMNMNHCVVMIASNFQHPSLPAHVRLRNSWGPGWGENGNINLSVGYNMCGYASYAEIPVF